MTSHLLSRRFLRNDFQLKMDSIKLDASETPSSQPDDYWEEQLLKSIEKALDVYGPTIKVVLYHVLETQYHLKRGDIPTHVEMFVKALNSFFGVGASRVEISIFRELNGEATVNVGINEKDFVEVLKEARHNLQRKFP